MAKKSTEDATESSMSVYVAARISPREKEALDRLIAARAHALARQGVTGQDTFASWVRAQIRKEADAAGFPVDDVPLDPTPGVSKKGGSTTRKPK